MRLSSTALLLLMATACATLTSSKAENGTTFDETSPNVRIQAFPGTIIEGQTEDFQVRCDYFGPNPLVSISLIKKGESSSDFVPLAHVAMNRPNHVVPQSGIQANQASGEIKADGRSSYLSIKWSTVTHQHKGLYACQVVALGSYGRVAKMQKSVRVMANEITVGGLLRIVMSQRNELELMKNEIESLKKKGGLVTEEVGSVKGEVASVKVEVESVNGEVGSVKGEVGSVKGQIEIIKAALGGWETYGNHTYYLKQNVKITDAKAQVFCEKMGGYLARIDDKEEHEFIMRFVNERSTGSSYTLVGGSDVKKEGTWVFQGTKTCVWYFDWDKREPNGRRDQNCLFIRSYNSRFHSWFCDLARIPEECRNGFVCEIPRSIASLVET